MIDAHPVFDRSTAAGRLMAGLDWSATPVGAPDTWPESLRGQVRTVLSSRYPMLLLWGEQYTQLYNDAYSALIGDQHPAAMGGDVRVTLAQGWPVLGPLITEAVATGVASWVPALQLLLERAGYREEAYFSVSHAPARDDRGVTRGVLTVCSEVTEQVVGQRRLQLLRDLSVLDDGTPSVERTVAALVAALSEDPLDVPFAGLYLRSGAVLRRASASVGDLPEEVPTAGDDGWGLARAATGGGPAASARAAELQVPGGPWGDPVTEALALPLPSADRRQPLGVLLVGLSPNRALDDEYRSFLDLLAQQVSVAVRNARAYEDERARAQALAELDRVKTSFFTNVSHEFRTPLTLMLGPLDDALADSAAPLPAVQRERVETALRGSRRLLKLVNNLMTFSSLEAGRATARRREVDLARLTGEVASSFRAAVERAGLSLEVQCPPLPRPVALDPEHWEQVVGNLLSNALKFTFVGRIAVRLAADDDGVRLEVEDTGVGIPAPELPRLFDRFHRVTGSRSRSQEGSGIGLALVRELAQLQGGAVDVDSQLGTGTRFVVRLPWAALEPPVGPPASEPAGALEDGTAPGGSVRAAVEEATSWTVPAADAGGPAPRPVSAAGAARVVVADDNADVRAYLVRLLREDGYVVEAVADGSAALAAALLDPPDLLITDVMMPGLDGFQLVRALRAEQRTAALPILVLSARAGEEASAEGLDGGADDYLTKPFTSQDLLARVRRTLRLARQRAGAGGAGGAVSPAEQERVLELARAVREAAALPAPPSAAPPAPHRAALREVEVELVLPAVLESAGRMRREVRAVLAAAGLDEDTAFALLLAASEAVNNAVEHAVDPTRPEVRVRVRVAAEPWRASIEVRDHGRWRERRPSMDRGRGAALMSAGGDVDVVPTPEGTVVTITRPLGG